MLVIRVQPSPGLRQEFARWATQRRPKVRTLSSTVFGLPPAEFTALPEELLIGALVDGRPYVPIPAEERERVPDVLPERECPGKCSGHLPPLPEDAYPAGAVPLDLAPVDEPEPPHPPPADEDQAQDADPGSPDGHPCPDPLCGRIFATARGLTSHARTHAKADG